MNYTEKIQNCVEKIEDWSRLPDAPLVSVCVLTYNHRAFIRQAMDSILMQSTGFPFEIVVGEDCSSDGTREIVLAYQKKHPDLIRLLLSTENLGRYTGNGRMNLIRNLNACRGKYVAYLEGDDAWTDPHKLSRQVACLESNPSAMICFGNATVIDRQGNVLLERKVPEAGCRNLTREELIGGGNLIPTSTVVFRNHPVLRRLGEFDYTVINGDTILYALLGQYGTAVYLDFKPSLYRHHPGGMYSSLSEDLKRDCRLNTYRNLHACINKEFRFCVADRIADTFRMRSAAYRQGNQFGKLIRNLIEHLYFSARWRPPMDFLKDLKDSVALVGKIVASRVPFLELKIRRLRLLVSSHSFR